MLRVVKHPWIWRRTGVKETKPPSGCFSSSQSVVIDLLRCNASTLSVNVISSCVRFFRAFQPPFWSTLPKSTPPRSTSFRSTLRRQRRRRQRVNVRGMCVSVPVFVQARTCRRGALGRTYEKAVDAASPTMAAPTDAITDGQPLLSKLTRTDPSTALHSQISA
jgi:hypothetical protein